MRRMGESKSWEAFPLAPGYRWWPWYSPKPHVIQALQQTSHRVSLFSSSQSSPSTCYSCAVSLCEHQGHPRRGNTSLNGKRPLGSYVGRRQHSFERSWTRSSWCSTRHRAVTHCMVTAAATAVIFIIEEWFISWLGLYESHAVRFQLSDLLFPLFLRLTNPSGITSCPL